MQELSSVFLQMAPQPQSLFTNDWQGKNNLTADGIVGEKTWDNILATKSDEIKTVET